MGWLRAIVCGTLVAGAILPAGCSGGSAGGHGGNVVRVTGNVAAATTWAEGAVYLVEDDVVVHATLSIRPGAIVKFGPRGSLATGGGGTIAAEGSRERRIAFTSIRDDARGGDTNGDGGAAAPSRGDWRGVALRGVGGSVFRCCDFLYSGGSADGATGAALDLGSTDRTVVDDCLFASNDGGDPDEPRGALRAGSAGAETIITRNVFWGNNVPLSIAPAVRVPEGNSFHDPANPSRANRFNGIFVSGGRLAVPAAWTATGAPYVVSGELDVCEALSVGAGTVVKLAAGARLRTANGGTIVAGGAAPAVFTAIRDDARGGDTNGDGDASSPSPGDWGSVILGGASGSAFRNCEFRYGGYYGDGALRLEQTGATTVDGCVFAFNKGNALDAAFAGAGTVVRNNTFYGNAVPLAFNERFDIDDSNRFHDPADPARKNRFNGIFLSPCGALEAPVRWSPTEVPVVVLQTLRLYDTLALGPGAVLKFQAGAGLEIYDRSGGALAGWQGAQFTSLRDDARLGDTNGDGNATTPAAGDWHGIWFETLDAGGSGYAAWPNIHYDLY